MLTLRRTWTLTLLLAWLLVVGGPAAALAQEPTPAPQPATTEPLQIVTDYPGQEFGIGESVSYSLKLRTGSKAQIVRLSVTGLEDGWGATFRGAGKIISSAYVRPGEDTSVELKLEPPADVQAGTYELTVVGEGEATRSQLPVELALKAKLPPNLIFDIDLPVLRGRPESQVSYSATLRNDGDEDLTVNLSSIAPPTMRVVFNVSGQELNSFPLAAKESKSVSVQVTPYPGMPAGLQQVTVVAEAEGGKARSELPLGLEIAGQAELSLSGPDGRLSGEAYVGEETPLSVVVTNNGSAPAYNIRLSGSSPSGWSVTFAPDQIPELGPGQQLEVKANVSPSKQAVAGDYVVTMTAQPAEGPSKNAEYRITVLASTMWGIVGVALIAVAVGVVGLAVSRFGRR